jgi:putative ABC transport system substrate-binding protein
LNPRRQVLIALGLGALAVPLRSLAQQQGKVWRIGFFYFSSRQSALDTGRYEAFLQGMRELGYVEGKHFVVEARFADGKSERLPGLAADLVQSRVDVIVATGGPVYSALQKVTRTIPIVATASPDAVGLGLAASLARPGGNFTGISTAISDFYPKFFELLNIAVPRLFRVAVLSSPFNPAHPPLVKNLEGEARKRGIRVLRVSAGAADEIERGFAVMTRDHADAVIILPDTFFVQQMRQIAALALDHRLPSTHWVLEYVDAGGFMSFGPNITDNFRLAAGYVDKILKGAKPADLPFEQPTLFYLVINRKTAKALGIAIPQELLLRADKVIE